VAGAQTFTLTSLDATQNIKTLVPGQKIEFNPRMAMVFGENASGKTAYVRVLKRARGRTHCRGRFVEREDVF
jgi:recombinational DNA repair ATPase RecF